MISFAVDALLIIICLFVIFISVKRGFVRTILSLVSAVAAVLLSVVFTPTVSDFLYNKFVLKTITDGIAATVESLVTDGTSRGIAEMFETMPEALSEILGRYGITDGMKEELIASANAGEATVQSISESIASPVATMISNVIAFVAVFIVSIIVLKIIILIIDVVFKLPGLDSVNKGAGLILGIILAAVVLFVYSESAVQLVNALGALSPDIFGEKVIEDTIIVKFFSEHNIFVMVRDVIEGGVSTVK